MLTEECTTQLSATQMVTDTAMPARRRSIRARGWLRKLSLPVVEGSTPGTVEKERERSKRRRLSTISQKGEEIQSWPEQDKHCPSVSRDRLLSTSFDTLVYSSDELLHVGLALFRHLNVLEALDVSEATIKQLLLAIRSNMPNNAYHSWWHCVDVAQACFSFGSLSGIYARMPPHYKFASMVAAFCHDLDHPGVNKHAFCDKHEKVVALFGGSSLLERRHVFVAGQILSSPELNLKAQLGTEKYFEVWDVVSAAILATDMERHGEFERSLRQGVVESDLRRQLCLLLKLADLSNVARPLRVSKKWGWLVSRELLPSASASTVGLVAGFIEGLAASFFREAAVAFPGLQAAAAAVEDNLEGWRALDDATLAVEVANDMAPGRAGTTKHDEAEEPHTVCTLRPRSLVVSSSP